MRSSLITLKNSNLKERSEHDEQDQQLRSRIRSLVYTHTEAFCTLLEIDVDSDMHSNVSQASATETMQDVASERKRSAEYERLADDSASVGAEAAVCLVITQPQPRKEKQA